MNEAALVADFERGRIPLASFPHRDHVAVAAGLLRRHDFAEALVRFSRGLRTMTARGGKPEAYHETITVAFLALIAERLAETPDASFDALIERHADLLDGKLPTRFYSAQRLASPRARHTFLLPDSCPAP